MMNARWEYGEAVRLTRNVRNDGTYPGLEPGDPLVRRGSIGYVVDVGTFLQDQMIHGCRHASNSAKKYGRPRACRSGVRY